MATNINKKTILVLTTFYNKRGGAEIIVNEELKRLTDEFNFIIFTTKSSGYQKFESNEHIKIYEMWGLPTLFLKHLIYVPASFIFSFFIKFDMVCAVMNYPALAAFLIKKIGGKPYVAFVFNEWDNKSWLRIKAEKFLIFEKIYKKVFTEAKYVRVISPTIGRQLERAGLEKNNIKAIFAGVDLQKFKLANVHRNPLQIITVTRFDELKGVDYLIKAIPDILKKFPLAEFVLIGDGPTRKELEVLINNLGVRQNVILTGWLDQKKIAKELNQSSIFVMPSLSEGLCLVILEAMACGLAVVATNVGGIIDLIKHRETGLLVPPANPQAIVKAIDLLLTDDKLRKRLTANALYFIKNFNWNNLSVEVRKLFV